MLNRFQKQLAQSPDGLLHAQYTGVTTYANDGIGMPHFALFGNIVNPISNTIASATTFSPLSYVTFVTGTAQIQNIVIPWPGFEGDIVLIFTNGAPGATLTGGTAGIALALASTPVQNKALTMTYSQINGLWYPSY